MAAKQWITSCALQVQQMQFELCPAEHLAGQLTRSHDMPVGQYEASDLVHDKASSIR